MAANCIVTEPIYQEFPLDDFTTWYGGARSLVSFSGDCWFGWDTLKPTSGVGIGLNDANSNTYVSDIAHGFIFTGNVYQLVEDGAILADFEEASAVTGARYYIYRIGGTVYYMVRPPNAVGQYFANAIPNRPLPGNIVFTSQRISSGRVFLDTALYQLDDGVENEASGTNWVSFEAESAIGNPSPTGANVTEAQGYGQLLFAMAATGTAAGETAIASWAEGELSIIGTGTSRSDVGAAGALVVNGIGFADGITSMGFGELVIEGCDCLAALPMKEGGRGHLHIEGAGDALAAVESGAAGEIEFLLRATGTAAGETPIDEWGQGELVFAGSGIGEVAPTANYMLVTLRFSEDIAPPVVGSDITETIVVATPPMQVSYINTLQEYVQLSSTIQTFINYKTELAESIIALTTQRADFVLQVAEQFDITESLTVTQVMRIAETLVATGTVETLYQAVATVLSAMGVNDNEITGGSAEGGTAGVSVQAFGPPSVEFTFVGYWKKGTEIQLSYTTDAGPGYISYTLEFAQLGPDVMALFAVALDAQPLVNATYDGTSVTMTAQAPATTVQL